MHTRAHTDSHTRTDARTHGRTHRHTWDATRRPCGGTDPNNIAMGQPAEWLQPRGEWGCSGRYHHADGCGDGRCAPWWRRFLSGSMFSVDPWFSVEVSLLSGRLRNSAVGAGLAAGSETSKACTLGLENPNPNPILWRSFACRSCFMLKSAGVVGGSWVCGSSADILPTLPHTSGSGPSGAALFIQPQRPAAARRKSLASRRG
jgi:hypothetical protein